MSEPVTNGTHAPLFPAPDPHLTAVVEHLDLRELLLERGTSGLRRAGGYVREEMLTDLVGLTGVRKYTDMKNNSAVIGACLYALEMLIRNVRWHFKPVDTSDTAQHYAEIADGMLFDDLDMPWSLLISEILSYLPYGWSWFEMVFKRRLGLFPPPLPDGSPALPSKFNDGYIGLGKIAPRAQETLLRWEFDSAGGLLGMHQLDPWMGHHAYIPYEKSLLFRPTSYKNSPEGRSVLRTAYRCFSEDTQLLTARGWTPVAEIRLDDSLATLRPDGVMEYHAPSALHAYQYAGQMLHIHSRGLDQLVTPNHHVYIKPVYPGARYRLREAAAISTYSCFKRDAIWDAPDIATYKIPAWVDGHGHLWPAHEVPMDDWLAFLAIFLAQGHTTRTKRGQRLVGVCQKRGWKCEKIREIVRAIGFPVYEHPQKERVLFEITRGQLYEVLRPFGKSHNTYVPDYVKQASARQMRLFLDIYLLGDGTPAYQTQRQTGEPIVNGPCLYTVSPRMADDLMELGIKAGYVSNVSWQKHINGFGAGVYRVPLSPPNKQGYLATHYDAVDYDGAVYCVTVPNHTVLARRNGRACWSGNSWYMIQHIENTEAISIERDGTGLPLIYAPAQWALPSATPEEVAQFELCKRLVRNVRIDEQMGLVLPAIFDQAGNQLLTFQLVTSGGARAINTDEIIQRYELRITQSLLCDLLFLGHEDVGSFALASSKSTIQSMSLGGYLTVIKDEFNRRCLPLLWRLNAFPEQYRPTLVHGDVETIDLTELARFMLSFGRLFNAQDLENTIRTLAGLPERPGAETHPLPPSIPSHAGLGSHGGGSSAGIESMQTGETGGQVGLPDLNRALEAESLALSVETPSLPVRKRRRAARASY